MTRYTVRESPPADGHTESLAVWERNFPAIEFAKRYDWYYRRNPCDVYSFLLTDENGRAIGAAGLAARRFHLFGEERLVGLCSDFSVDAGRRFLSPALQLQRSVLHRGLEQFPFVYGFPNDKAVAVMERVGYRLVCVIPNYTLVLRSAGYLHRTSLSPVSPAVDLATRIWMHLSGVTAADELQETHGVDSRFDDLWREADKAMFTAVRDARFLQWRFLHHPVDRFRVFVLPGEDSRLRGYIVARIDDNGYWRVFDFLVRPRTGSFKALLFALVRRAYDEGATAVNLEFFGDGRVHRALRAAGFWRRPHWRRVVAAAGDDAQAARLRIEANWYLTSADED